MRNTRTKIIATIGPSCRDPQVIGEMVNAGMDVARINCSHASAEFIQDVVADIRELSSRMEHPIGILLDLSGPKLRTSKLKNNEPVMLEKGKTFTLTNRKVEGTNEIVGTNYAPLSQEVKPGDSILLDDGLIELKVKSTNDTDVECEIIIGGLLKNHQGINIPGVRLSIPALTEKDREDLKVGLACEVDFVALSFVRDAQDIVELKELIGDHWPPVMVIAKLEKP
ncbi:MAG TPA: pyruvate kinase, partial [Candidatus Obscuribacter sp.]|nr:pyruvate kinase [Candidatus Obscuribacter sp.]